MDRKRKRRGNQQWSVWSEESGGWEYEKRSGEYKRSVYSWRRSPLTWSSLSTDATFLPQVSQLRGFVSRVCWPPWWHKVRVRGPSHGWTTSSEYKPTGTSCIHVFKGPCISLTITAGHRRGFVRRNWSVMPLGILSWKTLATHMWRWGTRWVSLLKKSSNSLKEKKHSIRRVWRWEVRE